ncbi:MAG: serine/threonine protein phosphatase [Nannocystaceae bacterium]|nr:serine/threonine protein phosphatase [Nannocystaceae bacterium]
MPARTFVVGDIHGDLASLRALMAKLPAPEPSDTMVFLGDYLDRGPDSAGVIEAVRRLQQHAPCKVVALRGNHEDAWLRVIDGGWPEFVLPPSNGCLAAMRSFTGRPHGDGPHEDEIDALFAGRFFPPEVVAWLRALAWFHEDEHAIYVHAGLVERDGVFAHPSAIDPPIAMLWTRSESFFRDYRGKLVVVGHTTTQTLPPELSSYTPADPADLWAGESVVAIDTGAGKGGFLTALELPARRVWESR